VKTFRTVALGLMGLVALGTSPLLAQQPPGQPPRQPSGNPAVGSGNPNSVMALVDLERMMNNYVRAKYVRDQIRKDKEAAEAAIRKESQEMEKEKEKLHEFRPGSREFKQLEESIAQRISELNVRIKIQQRDFQEREQKAFFQLYTEVTEEVKRYADAKGILLVMPYSSEPVDPNVPETMQRQLSRSFVYLNGPDITEPILQELNRRATQVAGPRPGAGGNPPNKQR
jgi:Skp family chaperone for outer membrane proteins